jgi:hypothetical protein
VVHVRIHEEFFAETRVEIRSPAAGMVIGLARNPFVIVGDAIVHIALTRDAGHVRGGRSAGDSEVL